MPDYRTATIAATYLPRLIAAGLSVDEAHAQAESVLGEVDRPFFNHLWGETVAALSRKENQSALPLNRKMTIDDFGTATRPRARGPLVNVSIPIYDPATDDVTWNVWGVRSRQPMSPAWYIQQAVEGFDAKVTQIPDYKGLTVVADAAFIDSAVMLVGPEEGE